MDLNHQLLLQSTKISDESNLLYNIHQSIIDLESDPPENEIQILLKQSILYLDENLDCRTLDDLFILIFQCLSHISNKINFYEEIYANSRKNSNRLIFFAMIFSELDEISSFSDLPNLINNTLNQISDQIQTPKDKFEIYGNEINPKYVGSFIINILLMTKLNENLVSIFFPYIFHQNNLSDAKILKLIQKVAYSKCLSILPEFILMDKRVFSVFQQDDWSVIIPNTSKQAFLQLFSYLEGIYSFPYISIYRPLAVSILEKYIEFNIEFKNECQLNIKMLESFNAEMMTASVFNYFLKYDVDFKKYSLFQYVSIDCLEKIFSESNDLKSYEKIINYNFDDKNIKAFSDKNFWVHFFSVISSSNVKYSEKLAVKIVSLFEKHIEPNKSYEIIESMILDEFPTNNNGNYFLCDFIKNLGFDYKNNFYLNKAVLFKRIIDLKVLPLPSFWPLFTQEYVETFLKDKNNEAIYLYAFYFAKQNDEQHEFKKIEVEINPLKNFKQIIELIKNKDLDLLASMNEESLSFTMSSLIYLKYKSHVSIKGLIVDTILPIFAIALVFEDDLINQTISCTNKLIIDAIRYLKRRSSPLSIELINLILLNLNIYSFSSIDNFEFHFYDILIDQLIEGNYVGDKVILIRRLFELSNRYSDEVQCKYLFDKNGINLCNHLIQNVTKITYFNDIKFNVQFLDFDKILLLSNNNKHLINMVNFMLSYYDYIWVSNLFTSSIKKLANAAIKLKTEDIIVLYEYIEKSQIINKLPLEKISIDINLLIDKILNNKNEESFDIYFEMLFKTLMKEKSIANDYYVIQIEKASCDQSLNLKTKYIIQNVNNFLFRNAFYNIFSWHSKSRQFIRNPHFQSITYPLSKTGLSIISKLLEVGSYQAYYCLLYIASLFPFLFTSNPRKVFTKVIQKLNLLSLIFTEKYLDGPLFIDAKTSFLAFKFLISLLHSVKILDSFVPWLFENILTFTPSQIFVMTYILGSLYKTKKVKSVTLAISIKYNFPEIASKLLEIEVPKEIRKFYKENIYIILRYHYELLNKLKGNKKMILVDEMACLSNPFEIAFNNFSTIFPCELESIEFPPMNNVDISKYVSYINIKKSFIDVNYKSSNNDSNLMRLNINGFKKCSTFETDEDFYDNYSSTIRFCVRQPNWVYKWLIKGKTFPCFVEHKKILKNVMKKASEFEQNQNVERIDIDYYFLDQLCQSNLFNMIIKEVEKNEIDVQKLVSPLIGEITKTQIGLDCFLSIINIYMLEHNNIKDDLLGKIFYSISQENIESFTNQLIDLALIPEHRTNSFFMTYIASLLLKTNEIPNNANHLIGFMLISNNPNLFKQALKICEKVEFKYLEDTQNILRKVINKQLSEKEAYSSSMFKLIIQLIPTYVIDNTKYTENVLNNAIRSYRNGEYRTEEALNFIFFLLCKLAPERQEEQLVIQSDEIDFSQSLRNSFSQSGNFSILNPAPSNFIKANPTFWNLYNQHRQFLNDIIEENEDLIDKLHFLEDFPELITFEKRLAVFRKRMKDKINNNIQQIIRVNRSNILSNSFDALNSISRDDWLYTIKVKFEGENGIDLGGLTKEWFTLVTKELLNPNIALFDLCENKSYKPNQLSSINHDHINYFKFAGKFIARAIIQGQCINAHFCRSFCRQILRHQIKLVDLVDLGTTVYNSMEHILNNDPEPLALNFTINIDEYGSCKTILLKENGDEIDVTNDNKVEYATLYANYYLRKSIIDQVTAFCEGFNYLIPHNEIKMFSPDELDLIICGIPNIDIEDMRNNTSYVEPYYEDHPVVLMFFSAISKWDPENLAKFLLFLTGSSQVPVNGFKDYADAETPITIAPGGNRDRLCVAHTCFNMLDLPEYEDEDELNEKLMLSIQECEFGIL